MCYTVLFLHNIIIKFIANCVTPLPLYSNVAYNTLVLCTYSWYMCNFPQETVTDIIMTRRHQISRAKIGFVKTLKLHTKRFVKFLHLNEFKCCQGIPSLSQLWFAFLCCLWILIFVATAWKRQETTAMSETHLYGTLRVSSDFNNIVLSSIWFFYIRCFIFYSIFNNF